MSDLDVAYQLAVRGVVEGGGAGDWFQLGVRLGEMRRWGGAAGCFARSCELAPEDFRGWANLGWHQHLTGREEAGASNLRRAIGLAPCEGTPRALLSQVLLTLGDVDGARLQAQRAVKLEPGPAINHMALAFALFASGRWCEGWLSYDQRGPYKLPEFAARDRLYRRWYGERVGTLYLEAEQGLGDCLFGLRWVWGAAARADRVVLYVHAKLYGLVRNCCDLPGNVEVYPLPRTLPAAEAWCPVLSLPVALGSGEPWFPSGGVYVGGLLPRKRANGVLDVGIVWAGNSTHEQAHHRDVALAHFLRLSEVPGVRLHALQFGEGAEQVGILGAYGLVRDRGPEITNFLDTAEIVAGLDLVVTVDTSMAHLAGAMGVRCWLLVNQRGRDFRWGPSGDWTGWYPSIRLWRRGLYEDWGAVMARLAQGLEELTCRS